MQNTETNRRGHGFKEAVKRCGFCFADARRHCVPASVC
jgi:hypothetical protein